MMVAELNLNSVMEALSGLREDVTTFIKEKPLQTAGVGAGVVGITGLAVAGVIAKKRKNKTTKKRTAKSKGRSRDRKFRSKQKHELAYVRRKRKAGKKITRPRYKTSKSKKRVGKTYYTKKGQPYKIMASGKARFIKKSKGGKR